MNETIVDEEFIESMNKYREPKRELGLIGACAENVVVFAEKMLGIRLYSWQIKVLSELQDEVLNRKEKYVEAYYSEDGTYKEPTNVEMELKEFCCITSRQIGKTKLADIIALWISVFNHGTSDIGKNTSIGVISISDDQAKMVLTEIKQLIFIGDAFMSKKYKDSEGKPVYGDKFFSSLLDPTKGNSADSITFKSYNPKIHGDYLLKNSVIGSTIYSYPPTARILGNKYSFVIIDEVGKSDKLTDLILDDYVQPTTVAHQAVKLFISTPWQTSGNFFRMIDPSDIYPELPSLKKYMFTVDALRLDNPTQYNTLMKKIREMNSDGKTNEVQRGYYCRFVKGDTCFFEPDDVNECFTDYKQYDECNEVCDLGIDFGGQVKSRTVFTISKMDEKSGQVMRLWHKSYPVGKDDTIIEDIRDLKKRFNIQRIVTEDIPQADYMIRTMKDLGWDVVAMLPRAEKVKKYTAFRAKLHKKEIHSYQDEDLRTEMLALETNNGSTQSIIEHAPGYQDDLIDSFMLSCYFFVNDEKKFTFYKW